MMKTCDNCNKNYSDDFGFCPMCGKKLTNQAIRSEHKGLVGDNLKIEQLKDKAEQGDIKSQLSLAYAYYEGRGIEENKEEAFKWYMKAAERSNSEAELNVGYMFDTGEGVEENKEEAFKWYMKAAWQGEPDAVYNVGCMYDTGEGVEENKEDAFYWYMIAAKNGYADAQYAVAEMYYEGEGVEINKFEALEWYIKSWKAGNFIAKIQLNIHYGITEDSTKKDIERIRRNLLIEMGNKYFHGPGGKTDFAKAIECYIMASKHGDKDIKDILEKGFAYLGKLKERANQGDVSAQLKLGQMYDEGKGVAEDKEEAFNWFMKAAKQGSCEGELNVGYMYDAGEGTAEDKGEAFKWFMKAAKQGHEEAQCAVAEMYYKGEGVEINKYEAFEWYMKASGTFSTADEELEEKFGITEYSNEEEIEEVRGDLLLELGDMYFKGIEKARNISKALECYTKATKHGNANAKIRFEQMIKDTEGIQLSVDEAYERLVSVVLNQSVSEHNGLQLKKIVDEVINTLSNREKEVLEFRFGLNDGKQRTLEEVGRYFGVTRERIRQIEAKAMRRLRSKQRGIQWLLKEK